MAGSRPGGAAQLAPYRPSIHQRLVEEPGAEVSERQVDRYVAPKRREIGEVEACVPLVSEDEVDWGEAQVIVRGEPRKVYLFLMRACHSGAAYVVAFEAETQQAFLEATSAPSSSSAASSA